MITVSQLNDANGTLVFAGATSLTISQVAGVLQVIGNQPIGPITSDAALQAKIDAALVEAQQTVLEAQQTVAKLT